MFHQHACLLEPAQDAIEEDELVASRSDARIKELEAI
jgi:hypothetical protein